MSAVPRGRSSCWTSGRSGDIKRTTNVSTVSNLGGLIRRFFSHGHQCGAGVHRTQGSRRRPPRRQHRRRVAGEPGCAARVADLQPRRDAGAARRPEFPTTPPARRFCFSTTPLTARLPRRRAASLPAHSCNRDSSQGLQLQAVPLTLHPSARCSTTPRCRALPRCRQVSHGLQLQPLWRQPLQL